MPSHYCDVGLVASKAYKAYLSADANSTLNQDATRLINAASKDCQNVTKYCSKQTKCNFAIANGVEVAQICLSHVDYHNLKCDGKIA